MGVRTIWESMERRRFLLSWWPWRGVAHVLSTPLVSALAGLALAALGLPWWYLVSRLLGPDSVAPVEVGLAGLGGVLLIIAAGPLLALPVAQVERWRLRLVHNGPVRRTRPLVRYTDPLVWREVAHLVVVALAVLPATALFLTATMVGALIISPLLVAPHRTLALGLAQASTAAEALPFALLGLFLVPVVLYLFAGLAALHAAVTRALLSEADLRSELVRVSQSRERLVTAFEAERRRIERDLHDGAQQRLVALILQLGLAKLDAPGVESVATAHEQAKQLLNELREFIHGIHPQALSDLGLPAALQELADRSATPVTVSCTIPRRPPSTVESAGYFVAAEALGNALKHSGATEISIRAGVERDVLTVEIHDNGQGGANGRGSGLTGLADRAAAHGGTLFLSSPVGGPTTVRAEFPCP